jgi:hypothetical protein
MRVSGQRFIPGENTHGTQLIEGWVGPRAGLDTEVRGTILCLCRGSNPDRPDIQSVVRHYTDCATTAPINIFVTDLFIHSENVFEVIYKRIFIARSLFYAVPYH